MTGTKTVKFSDVAVGDEFAAKGVRKTFRKLDSTFACPADLKHPMLTDYYPFKADEDVEVPETQNDRAWKLRTDYYPYKLVELEGKTMEVISFPFPNKESVGVMIREPNDPTTMREHILWPTEVSDQTREYGADQERYEG